jgi:hypothetical protein
MSRKSQTQTEDPFIEWLAWLMDESIQVGPWSFGIDPLIGLIPGVGDMAGAVVSTIIVVSAMKSGIPKSAVIRMVINVAVDSLGGAVPFVGDLFDFAFKSNIRNVQIYRESLRGERQPLKDWFFVVFVFLMLLLILILPILGLIYLAKLIAHYVY